MKKRFAYIGIGLGFLFPIMALGIDFLVRDVSLSLSGIVELHKQNPLHFIIDSAPIVLGLVFYYMGATVEKREEKLKEISDARNKRFSILTSFITQLNEGNLEVELDGTEDEVSQLLISLRDKLRKDKEEEEIRNWSNSGLASFGEVLRNTQDMDSLANDIIIHLVKYLKVNQGSLFVVNQDGDEGDVVLELKSAYAFDRKKYMEKKVHPGQGLIGQCYKEKDIIQLTEIPDNYINITSGLGTEVPSYLILVPLKSEEEVVGIIELASFHVLKPFEIEFLEKLGVSIASVMKSTRVNDQTQKLLHSTQEQAEQLRSQEEEMRQNMEELAATQEEMHRKEQEYIRQLEDYRSREN